LGKGLKKSAQAKAKPRRRVLTIIECSLQCEATPFPARAAVQALRANMIRLVHPLPMNGFYLSRLSLGLKNAICNHALVVDTSLP
jgi:hypothetical protein